MSEIENNKNNKDEQVADVSSLMNLCAREENLPTLQVLGMKQRVAFRFERMLHSYMYNCGKATSKFATYITLLETKPNIYGNVCDVLLDFVSEDVIEECLMYIRSGIIPYHLWTDKLLEDIKGSAFYNNESVAGMLTVYLGKALRASLIAYHKAIKALEDEEHLLNDDMKAGIEFVKTRYMEIPQEVREEYMTAFNTDDEVKRRKFADNETTIFTETLVDMLQKPISQEALEAAEQGQLGPYDIFWVEPLFGGGATLVSNARGEGGVATGVQPQQAQQQQQPAGMGSWLEVIGRGPNGETAEEMKKREELRRMNLEKVLDKEDLELVDKVKEDVRELRQEQPTRKIENVATQYKVEKVCKDSSQRVMSVNWFDTEEEAQEFVDELKENNPMMMRSFDFKITPGVRP